MLRAGPGKPGAGKPHAGFHLGGEAQGRPRPLSTNHHINHEVLLSILGEQIHDNRFVRHMSNMLKAGYLEEWTYNATLSGTPQGGVISPLLSNLDLDLLDQFVAKV